MSILSKIKSLFTYVDIKPLIYDEHLRQAYSSTSVTGGTMIGKNVVLPVVVEPETKAEKGNACDGSD